MTKNIYRNFILDNSLAAVSAIPNTDHTLATDGINCIIHRIAPDGTNLSCHSTLRPLRRIRKSPNHCVITALGCCSDRNFYFLDENLKELGFVTLESEPRSLACPSPSCTNGCQCTCGCASCCNCGNVCGLDTYSEITDASLISFGGERYILGAFRKGAYLFDTNGKLLTQICKTDRNEILTDFIYTQNGVFAMATRCGNTQTVTISCNENTQSSVLDRGYSLRMLIEDGDEIYGLFGRSYIYNRIIKIYSGNIMLPRP